MGELFAYIFDGIADRYNHELKVISQQYPFEPLKYLRPGLRITFQEGITLLPVRTHARTRRECHLIYFPYMCPQGYLYILVLYRKLVLTHHMMPI